MDQKRTDPTDPDPDPQHWIGSWRKQQIIQKFYKRVTLVSISCLFSDWLPDGGGALLGEDLEHEEAVHGRARPVQEGDQTTATSKEQ